MLRSLSLAAFSSTSPPSLPSGKGPTGLASEAQKNMLQSLSFAAFSSVSRPAKIFKAHNLSLSPPPLNVKLPSPDLENVMYLKAIGIIDANTESDNLPPHDAIKKILATLDFFKSKGFKDSDFSRLALHCPQLFSNTDQDIDLEPFFQFLSSEVHASDRESKGLVLQCPRLVGFDVQSRLRPTLEYLRELGIERLNVPTRLNAFLLNLPVDKLRGKVNFLQIVGCSREEAQGMCARNRSILGYSVDKNLRPKVEYLKLEMGRGLEEVLDFPAYFGFSLEKRIVPRHLHLKERGVDIPLCNMLIGSDKAFYDKWK